MIFKCMFNSYILLQIQIARAIMMDVNSSMRVALAPVTPPTAIQQNTNRVLYSRLAYAYLPIAFVCCFLLGTLVGKG